MKISAKTDYALKALVELAMHWPSMVPLRIYTISDRQKIPVKFLIQILLNLKQMGYVRSVRGKQGGYLLVKKPKDIKLIDLIKNFDGGGMLGSSEIVDEVANNDMVFMWQDIDEKISRILEKIDVEQICHQIRARKRSFNYQI